MLKSSFPAILAAALLVGCATDQSAEVERLEAELAALRASSVAPLPAAITNFYPPVADGPLWLMQMHTMVTPLISTIGSVQAGDMQKAAGYVEEFEKQFITTSKMVPEWTERFEIGPVNAFKEAVASGDPEATMGAMGPLVQVCHNCHYENMVRVQQRFRWPKFSEVSVSHPERGELTLSDVMFGVEVPMVGVGVSLMEGSPEQARANFEMFKQSFSLLEETCENCHETERTYFVDESVHNLIGRLGTALAAESPDPQAVGMLLQTIGEETCNKCHLVHIPAAFEQTKAAMESGALAAH